MVQHPLKLLAATQQPTNEPHKLLIGHECATIILSSFVDEILVPKCTAAIQYFIVPCLSQWPNFPFLHLLQYLHETIIGMSTITTSDQEFPVRQQRIQQIFGSPYCFEAFLLLDELHQSQIDTNIALVKSYIQVIARFSNNLRRLEQRSTQSVFQHMDIDGTEDYDSDDDDSPSETIPADVRDCLLNVIALLNVEKRVNIIVEHNDCFLEEYLTMHSLCKICHNLMLYQRTAFLEYRYVEIIGYTQ